MTFRTAGPTRLVYLLFAVAFVWATGGQAFGLRPCPVHDALPGSHAPATDGSAEAVADASSDRAVHSGTESARQDHRDPHDGPCTCLDDCHVGASELASIAGPVLIAGFPTAPVRSVLGSEAGELLGPRHRLFELHLPNAPPIHR